MDGEGMGAEEPWDGRKGKKGGWEAGVKVGGIENERVFLTAFAQKLSGFRLCGQ